MFILKINHGYVSVTATFDTPVTKDFGSTETLEILTSEFSFIPIIM